MWCALVLLIVYGSSAQAAEQKKTLVPFALTIPVSVYATQRSVNEVDNKPTTITTSKSQATSDATAVAKATAKNNNTIQNIITYIQKEAPVVLTTLKTWVTTHKLPIASTAAVTIYLGMLAMIMQGNQYLTPNGMRWGHWKRHLSVKELYTAGLDEHKKQELAHHLITAILHRYFKPQQPTNYIEPFVDFMQALEQEMKIMHRYITIALCIQKLHLIKLFPTNAKKITQAKEYRQRLHYIKQLFISSMAHHKLNQLLLAVPHISSTPVAA